MATKHAFGGNSVRPDDFSELDPVVDDVTAVDDAGAQSVVSVHLPSSRFVLCNRSTAMLAHPLMWIAAGTSVFLAAWLFPSSLYAQFFQTESRVFLDLTSFLYSGACVLLTCMGLWVGGGGRFFDFPLRFAAGTDLDEAPATRISLLLLMIAANITSVALFFRAGGISAVIASLKGETLLNVGLLDVVQNSGGMLWIAALLAPAAFLPLAWQLYRSQPGAAWTRLLVTVFFGTYVVAAMLASRRSLFASPLLGLLIVYLVWPSRRGLTQVRAISVCAIAALVVVVLFLSLGAIRRGWNGPQDVVSEPVRYLITPYNTQALMIHGELVLPGASKGYYWTEWIWKFPLLDNVLHLEEWRSMFLGEKGLHGVNERHGVLKSQGVQTVTSLPAFACSFFDLGWFGPLPFFLTGWIAGFSWRGFLRGSSCQLLLFPVIAYSFVEWRCNLLFPSLHSDYVLMLMCFIKLGLLLETRSRSSITVRRSARA